MKALIIVDIQNDFLPGGALEVPNGDRVIPVINRISSKFKTAVATQDWHPANHKSFAVNQPGHVKPFEKGNVGGIEQVVWPVHCVQGTPGAELSVDLDLKPVKAIIRKGTDPEVDSYSAFFDMMGKNKTGLDGYLRDLGVTDVYVCGLAADVCVYYTSLDACRLGYNTWFIEDASQAVEVNKGDYEHAKESMIKAGVHVVQSTDIMNF